jgi:transcriptional regulator with XRE-family HTH domain
MTSFSAALATALKAAKMSQAEIARRVGCGRGAISAYLAGRDIPRPERLAAINAALGAELRVTRPVTVKEAARGLGISYRAMCKSLQQGVSDVGFARRTPSGQYRYTIYPMVYLSKVGY